MPLCGSQVGVALRKANQLGICGTDMRRDEVAPMSTRLRPFHVPKNYRYLTVHSTSHGTIAAVVNRLACGLAFAATAPQDLYFPYFKAVGIRRM